MKANWQASLLVCGLLWMFADGRTVMHGERESLWDLLRKQRLRAGDVDLSKPGNCPPEANVSKQSSFVCSFDCLFDLECPGTQRCCPDDCRGATCVDVNMENEESSAESPTLNSEVLRATEQTTVQTDPTGESTASTPWTELAKTSEVILSTERHLTKPNTTISTAKATETTNSPGDSGNSDLYLDGPAVVNVSVAAGTVLVLRCDISTSAAEPLFIFWMVLEDGRFYPWDDVPPTGNKRVSHDGTRLEILGATSEDSRNFVCFGGHSTGYLTQTYVLMVTENTGDANLANLTGSCANNECANGATCVSDVDQTYRCVCPDGYQGQYCTIPVDPCERYSSICKNGATCVRVGDGFTCECAAGWEGADCGQRVSVCRSSPCRNGGECVDLVKAFRCSCPPEFTGPRCERAATPEPTTVEVTTTPPQTTEPMSDVCYLPVEKGSCARKESKWYYDIEKEQCQPFIYSGCRGNGNRFRSYEECHSACPRLPRDPCFHPILTGRCKARIPRWAYSSETKTCVEFVYGGCNPTGNNFLTRKACTETCVADQNQQQSCSCNTPGLPIAFCDSDFVISGIVRRRNYAGGRLKTVTVELVKKYKGRNLTTRRSRFFDRPLVTIRTQPEESSRCQSTCFGDIEDGLNKEYILTGTLEREGGRSTVAYLTSSSYVKRAVSRRLAKLDSMISDNLLKVGCSLRQQNPLQEFSRLFDVLQRD